MRLGSVEFALVRPSLLPSLAAPFESLVARSALAHDSPARVSVSCVCSVLKQERRASVGALPRDHECAGYHQHRVLRALLDRLPLVRLT